MKSSIRQKLILIILAVTITSLLLGFSFEILSNVRNLRNDLVNNITLNAKLIADYAEPTLLFDDKDEADRILEKLSNIPSVVHGHILNSGGKQFSGYFINHNSDTSFYHDMDYIKKNNLIEITTPVISSGEKIGEVTLVATPAIIKEKAVSHIKTILVIFILTSGIAVFLAVLLEKIISKPILDLSLVTREIRTSNDFSIRVNKRSQDEIGVLYDSFNDLLKSLGERKAERDKAEAALIEERENLEKKVKERTEKLNAAKIKAEESDRLKSSFLSNMSHEIRTPLNALVGFSELLAENMTSPEEKTYAVNCIHESKDDLINLVENVLDTSSLETNQLILARSDFDINAGVISLINDLNEPLKRKRNNSVGIRSSLGSTAGIKIITDGRRVLQVLRQLVHNAIKYTENGIIEIGTFMPNPGEVGFYVKDTGCGIPEAEKDKIFGRFYKIETEKNKLYRGVGIGLTLVKGLVTTLNGKIWLESIVNSGSTFYFTIPIPGVVKHENIKTVSPVADSKIFANKRILIAEDKITNYAYLSFLLKKHGMHTVNATNGIEAVELAQSSDFDMVMMDILMPEMDGYEAARQIRKTNPSIPIIAQTAFDFNKEEPNMISLFDDFLVKPITPQVLLNTMSKYLRR